MEPQPCLLTALAATEARGWLIRDTRGAEERPSDEFGADRKGYPGMQAGSAGVHSPDNKVCGACIHLSMSGAAVPSVTATIPIPRQGFCSLSPAPHDV